MDEAEAASSDRRQRGHAPPSLHAHKLFVIMKGRKINKIVVLVWECEWGEAPPIDAGLSGQPP